MEVVMGESRSGEWGFEMDELSQSSFEITRWPRSVEFESKR